MCDITFAKYIDSEKGSAQRGFGWLCIEATHYAKIAA
jgi:hypothetical protein